MVQWKGWFLSSRRSKYEIGAWNSKANSLSIKLQGRNGQQSGSSKEFWKISKHSLWHCIFTTEFTFPRDDEHFQEFHNKGS